MMGLKGVYKRKVKAASILEVVIALVLILLIFGIAMLTFVNVTRSGISFQKVNGSVILKNIYLDTKKEKSFFDEDIVENNNTITKHISKYKDYNNLMLLELEMKNQEGTVLAKRKDLILSYEKD